MTHKRKPSMFPEYISTSESVKEIKSLPIWLAKARVLQIMVEDEIASRQDQIAYMIHAERRCRKRSRWITVIQLWNGGAFEYPTRMLVNRIDDLKERKVK